MEQLFIDTGIKLAASEFKELNSKCGKHLCRGLSLDAACEELNGAIASYSRYNHRKTLPTASIAVLRELTAMRRVRDGRTVSFVTPMVGTEPCEPRTTQWNKRLHDEYHGETPEMLLRS